MTDCIFIVRDANDRSGRAFASCCALIWDCDESSALCVYAGSIITLVAPSLIPHFRTMSTVLGVSLIDVSLPSEIDSLFLDEDAIVKMDWATIAVIWACGVMCLFKSVTAANFQGFMRKRVKELVNRAGIVPDKGATAPFTFSQAQMVRQKLGGDRDFCGNVILFLLGEAQSGSDFAPICEYLTEFLAWNGMGAFTFISKEFIETRSAILRELSLRTEIKNLAEALSTINSHPYSQFFRCLGQSDQMYKLSRSRFRILMKSKSNL
ncbi:unnamed protein product [Cuscuta epithymum]|uniref:Uncharacterized protein n=1 Tax=Cuscuta epithymum TaxID=186058 RepID=A0AAV0F0S5_9ASTE|nr:unnamed protein product [Cuscuta epithymum]